MNSSQNSNSEIEMNSSQNSNYENESEEELLEIIKSKYNEGEKESKNLNNINKNREIYLEIICKIKFNKYLDEIYKVYLLSDKRISIETEHKIKIYSLKTFQLITEIKIESKYNSIELKNKDIAVAHYVNIDFYKLSGKKYILYQKIKDEEEIISIYELKNGNLIAGIHRGLIIYQKEKGQYKLLSKYDMPDHVQKIIEIKDDILFIFCIGGSSYATADYIPFYLLNLDIKNKKVSNLYSSIVWYGNDKDALFDCNFLIYKNKYLFVRYAQSFDIYNIEGDIKFINDKNKKNYFFHIFSEGFCHYNNDNFIIFPALDICKYDEKSNEFIFVNKFPFKKDNINEIIKLKNNNFIIYTKNEVYLIKNFN